MRIAERYRTLPPACTAANTSSPVATNFSGRPTDPSIFPGAVQEYRDARSLEDEQPPRTPPRAGLRLDDIRGAKNEESHGQDKTEPPPSARGATGQRGAGQGKAQPEHRLHEVAGNRKIFHTPLPMQNDAPDRRWEDASGGFSAYVAR